MVEMTWFLYGESMRTVSNVKRAERGKGRDNLKNAAESPKFKSQLLYQKWSQ
jgi:hypothetical protein